MFVIIAYVITDVCVVICLVGMEVYVYISNVHF